MGCDGLSGWLACGQVRDLRVRRDTRRESTGFDRPALDSVVRADLVRAAQGDLPFILRISKPTQAAVHAGFGQAGRGRYVTARQTAGSRSVWNQ